MDSRARAEAKRQARLKEKREQAAEKRRIDAGLPVNWRRMGAGEKTLGDALGYEGMEITLQQRVGRYLIDLGAWPVAFEVWSSGGFPAKSVATQRQRTIELAKLGWTICYVKLTRHHREGWDPDLPGYLKTYRGLVLDGHAPTCATFRGLEVASEAALVGDELVHEDHPDWDWRRYVEATARAEEYARWERRAERRRERTYERRGLPVPPRTRPLVRQPPRNARYGFGYW